MNCELDLEMKKILITLFFVCTIFTVFGQNEYILSPDSKLTIAGTSTVHDWTVTANTMEGSVKVEESFPKEIDFRVAVADIKSERGAAMDKKMYSALKKDEHPKVSFRLEQIKSTSILVGLLTIAGTEKNVEIATEISSEGDIMRIKGQQKIILQDFGMTPPTAMFGQIIVGDEVTVSFELIFNKG